MDSARSAQAQISSRSNYTQSGVAVDRNGADSSRQNSARSNQSQIRDNVFGVWEGDEINDIEASRPNTARSQLNTARSTASQSGGAFGLGAVLEAVKESTGPCSRTSSTRMKEAPHSTLAQRHDEKLKDFMAKIKKDNPDELLAVEMEKQGDDEDDDKSASLGIELEKDYTGVYIKHIMPNTAAHGNILLAEGDQVLVCVYLYVCMCLYVCI